LVFLVVRGFGHGAPDPRVWLEDHSPRRRCGSNNPVSRLIDRKLLMASIKVRELQ